MGSEGKTYAEIVEILRNKGYKGTIDAICGFMSNERKLEKDLKDASIESPSKLIERKWLIQLLFL